MCNHVFIQQIFTDPVLGVRDSAWHWGANGKQQ